MKKVLILANSVVGLHNFRYELIEKLISLNFDVYFSVPEEPHHALVQRLTDLGATSICTVMDRRGMRPVKEIRLYRSYVRIIKETKPDIILTYTIKPNIYGTIASSKFSKPVIMNVTGLGSAINSSKLKSVFLALYKKACSQASTVFFQNKSNLNYFLENKIIDRTKVRLIPGSGVNVTKYSPSPKKINDGITRFLFIGRLMYDKGIEEFIEAANIITEQFPKVIFQVLGPLEEEKYRNVFNQKTQSSFQYLGVSEDVRAEISNADCVVNPSHHEGMSNVLLESAAMGKPLIATRIPGCEEIIDDGKNGYLYEATSAKDLIRKLKLFISTSDIEREKMGNYSREKVSKEFNRDIIVSEYISEIDNLTD